MDHLFGVTSVGESSVDKILSYFELGFHPNLAALCVGLFVILFMIAFPKKWNAVVPSSLIGIILATVLVKLLKLPVDVVGEIPKTLLPAERLTFSALSLKTLLNLLSPAFSIAMLGMIESLLCGSSAGRMTGKRLDSDRELVAQGIGNMILPFFRRHSCDGGHRAHQCCHQIRRADPADRHFPFARAGGFPCFCSLR